MFRFTIRDMLWFTVLLGLGLAWWVDRSRLTTVMSKALLWRGRAGALEDILRADGVEVRWDFEAGEVCAFWPDPGGMRCRTTSFYEPSADPKP